MNKKTSFLKLIQFWGIVCLLGVGISFAAIDVFDTYRDFKLRTEYMRENHIAVKKKMIQQEVKHVVDMIAYQRAQSEALTRRKIKSRVYEAYSIAKNIYQQHKSIKSMAEIQQIVLDALRPLRFENGSGYYFATRLDGVEMLFADKPEMEGLDLLNMQDTRGRYVIKDMIEIVKQSGEGFYTYHWTKPDATGEDYPKISFIKFFEPFNWFFGTGLYVDDVERQNINDMLSNISRIRFGKEGYIFVNRLNGDALVSNGKVFSGTKKLWEVFSKAPEKTKEIFRKEYNAALKPGGDYIYYSWEKLSDSNMESAKVSFIYGISQLQWLVGAGVYLDEADKDIALVQNELANQIRMKAIYFIMIVIGVVSLFLFLFRRVNRRLENDFNLFVSFFKRAARSDEIIDRERVQFVELDRIAEDANKMLSDRRQAEEMLWEKERFQEKLLNDMITFIGVLDPSGDVIFINNTPLKVGGLKLEDLVGKKFFDARWWTHSDEVRETIMCDIEKCASGETMVHDIQIQTADGSLMWIEYNMHPIFDEHGVVQYLIPEGRDITERKQTEEELKNSEELFRDMVEKLPFPLAVGGADIKTEYINSKFTEVFGYTIEDMPDQKAWREKFFPDPEYRAEISREVDDWIEKKDYLTTFARCYTDKWGREHDVIVWVMNLRDRFYNIIEDITERKQAAQEKEKLQAQLRQAQKMESIGTLAGGIAHDFNNALYSMIGFTELAMDDIPEGSLAKENLQEVLIGALRAKEMVKQILAFSREADSEKKPVEIQSVVKEALKLLRNSIPSTVEIRSDIDVDYDSVLADSTQIHQLVMNLATNAYQAMRKAGGVLELTLTQAAIGADDADLDLAPGSYLKLTVSDTGEGIDHVVIQRIFDPYFSTKAPGEGTGMGLAVVHGIVKSHGGDIKVLSELGKGTVFHVYLPLLDKIRPDETGTVPIRPAPTGTEHVLLVDDEENIVLMTQQMLMRLGYQVTSRTGSVEALEAFRANPEAFDLVITDMTMPNMTGVELASRIKSIKPDIPIITCSGFSEMMDEDKAKNIGIAAYIMKPILKAELAGIVRKVLDAAKDGA